MAFGRESCVFPHFSPDKSQDSITNADFQCGQSRRCERVNGIGERKTNSSWVSLCSLRNNTFRNGRNSSILLSYKFKYKGLGFLALAVNQFSRRKKPEFKFMAKAATFLLIYRYQTTFRIIYRYQRKRKLGWNHIRLHPEGTYLPYVEMSECY